MSKQQIPPNARYVKDLSNPAEATLRLLVEYARDILILLDQEGVMQFVNSSILRTLGYLPEDLIARRGISQLIHPDELNELEGKILSLIHNNEIQVTCTARVKHQDGSWRTLEIVASNLLEHPAIHGIVLNARDVTDVIQAQEKVNQLLAELQHSNSELANERAQLSARVEEQTALMRSANAELARALRTRDDFLANMSHELRTPLTSILGQAELLVEGIHGDLLAEQEASVQMIQFSGQRLLDLINDILELVKLEAGRSELQVQPILAETACGMAAQIVQRQARQKKVSIEMPPANHETYVLADEQRLHQILVNLLSNAIKFTPVGGKIGIRISEDVEQEAVHIAIWDSGIGIKNEDMRHLFQPFTQLDSSLDRHHEGTGLGLALVYQLTEMLGGSVTVESIPGEGSRFTVSLVQGNEAGKVLVEITDGQNGHIVPQISLANSPIERTPPEDALRILLAEDNEGNVDTIVQYLSFRGHEVLVAIDGAQAIELSIREEPDIIIMDMQMPVIDGLEATRRLRTHPKLVATPIIALTGLAMPGDKENCLAAGANAYMSKPISLRRLDTLIQELVADNVLN